ncbi:hypothetical protein [Actinoallomurus sp. NPDC050550]|uniref:hypothetical protein n=1 Tax=Actinoallomurus sp. NPDC050550 TaxID=3154937 RepID=UPI0033D549F6
MSGRHRDEARKVRTDGARGAPASALRWIAFGGGSIAALGLVIVGATVLFRHGREAKGDTTGTMPSAMASMLTAPANPFEPSVSVAPAASESPRATPAAKVTHRAPVVRTTSTRPEAPPTRPPETRPPGKPVVTPTRTHCVLPSGVPCTLP